MISTGTSHKPVIRRWPFMLLTALLASSCASTGTVDQAASQPPEQPVTVGEQSDIQQALPAAAVPATIAATGTGTLPREELYQAGDSRFVKHVPATDGGGDGSGDITLNFENTALPEVLKVILGDLLGENYLIETKLEGSVTLQTTRPVEQDALLSILEILLANNEAALVRQNGIYRIVDRKHAAGATDIATAGPTLPIGYQVRVVPLAYIAVEEMEKILKPLSKEQNILHVDAARNLLVIAGTPADLANLQNTIATFDVDWLQGMSFGLFTPDYVDAKTLAGELDQIFGKKSAGALAGLVRIVPIDRLNALLVVTPRASYLEKVKRWIERLDLETGGSGRRLFIYPVENGKATELATVLGQIFDQAGSAASVPQATLAPGLTPAQAGDSAAAADDGADEEGLSLQSSNSIKIIADEVNNTLLVLATVQEFRMVKAALAKMDITPLQVLVEAVIAEITLTDDLQHGLQWFFKNNHGSLGDIVTLDSGAGLVGSAAPALPVANSFAYTITGGGIVRAVLTALAAESKVNIISSPSLMVLNNQKAQIQVGDQVPVQTQNQSTTGGTVLSSFEYRDTGILLTVTPRVNAGGLITMEIEQEASEVGATPAGSANPIISQRKIQSVVAVQSGDTVVLGGLIRERAEKTNSGVPVLHTLPVVGGLFGSKVDNNTRTELVVLLTPRAVENRTDARAVTEEFKLKMEGLKQFEQDEQSRTNYQRPAALRLDRSLKK